MHVAVGIIDVKNYYIETVDDVAERIQRCLNIFLQKNYQWHLIAV